MTPTWHSEQPPELVDVPLTGKIRALFRALLLVPVLLLGVAVMLVLRLAERPIHGAARPWTAWITVVVCRLALRILGLRLHSTGQPMRASGIFAANHCSWLDIFSLNAGAPLIFVSKAEVGAWPGIGLLAKITGTVFVRRARAEAAAQRDMFLDRLSAGQRLLFFPEGTSSDGQRVLPFKPTLFAALFSEPLRETQSVQPVSVSYTAPSGRDPRFYSWWGDMEFGPHLLQVLAEPRQGHVTIHWHNPIKVADVADRKELSAAAEAAVRSAHPAS